MRSLFDDAAVQRIGDAVCDLESRSSAEIVVVMHARSGSYAHADARFAALLTLLSLAVLVFMPFTVPPIAVLLDPIIVYVLGITMARLSPALRRLFTTKRERREAVKTHAAAQFHRRGIANTTGGTGVLLFVSLLERRIEVLADRGLLRKVVSNEWNTAVAALQIERRLDPDAVIAAIGMLAPILTRDVPAGKANPDELSSTPEIELA